MANLIFLLAALAFCLDIPLAGRPAGGEMYYSYSRDFGGENLGKVEWSYDGTGVFSLGAPMPLLNVTKPFGLVFLPDGDLLVAAGVGKNEIYKANPKAKTFAIQKNTWTSPEHIFVEPGLQNAWVADNRGFLFKTPLRPYGNAVMVRPSGADNTINTLAYKDAATAWYSTSVEGDSTGFGTVDPISMVTTRKLTLKPYINNMNYDPFLDNVILCGDKTILQVDAAGAVVSQREFKHVTEFYACVVDGEGHVILSDARGLVYFIDYSATGKIGDTANFSDSLMLVPGMYYIAPLIGPGSPPLVRRPYFTGTKAVYRDGDGNGRIDEAVLEFSKAAHQMPALVQLPDPLAPARAITVDSAHITRLDFTHVRVEFRDREFPYGTAVPPKVYGNILQDTALFGTAAIPIGDGAGPLAKTAEAVPPQKRGDKPFLKVTFSEQVKVATDSTVLPFRIKRAGTDMSGSMVVSSVESLGNNVYKYTFSSAEFPLVGDSLKLRTGTPQVIDTAQNLSNMGIDIEVGGLPFPVFAILPEKLPCIVSYQGLGNPAPVPLANSILIVDPVQPGICLNCADGRINTALAGAFASPGSAGFQPWLLTVKIQGPIRYDFTFFSTLGGFINKASGYIDESILKRMQAGKDGSYTLRLYWWPVTADGRQAATGAYIVRGALSGEGVEGPRPESSQKPLSLPKKTEKISSTFGYLRR